MRILVTLAAAAVGAWVCNRLNVPGGTVVGAMIGAAGISLASTGAPVEIPRPITWSAYVAVGAVIGAGISRDLLADMRAMLLPAVAAGLLIIAFGLVTAAVLRWFGVELEPLVLATSPGALSAVTAAAAEQGQGAPVALFHTVRVLLVLLSLPLLVRVTGG